MNKITRFIKLNKSWYAKYHAFQLKFYQLKCKYWYAHFLNKCGGNNIIFPPIFITPEFIQLSSNVLIWPNCRIEGISHYAGEQYNPLIKIEESVSIQQNLHLTCAKQIIIGKQTAIAANVTITDINHPYNDVFNSIESAKLTVSSVIIGNECKIYNNTIILPGTQIGKHCTIGANSIVSGIIPDYCVAIGAPAKIIKRYSFEQEKWLKTDKKGNFIEE